MGLDDLFRREAVEHRQQKLYGEVLLHVPVSRWPITMVVVLIFVVLLGFLFLGRYARKETVSGWLRPDGGLIRVEAPADGVVESLPANEGQQLSAGAEVATLRLGGQLDASQSLAARLLMELALEREQLDLQVRATHERFERRAARLKDEVVAMEVELGQYRKQLQTLDRRAELAQRQVQDQADLLKQGYIARRDADKLEEAWLSAQSRSEAVRQDMLTRDTTLRSTRHELAGLAYERDMALAELGEKRAALEQRSAEAARRGQVVLTAPVAAKLATLRVEPGAAVRAGALVADLLPQHGRLQVELFAPSRALGFLKPGDEVHLRLDAYPYQTFGTALGHVQAIARSAVDASELPVRQALQGPVYRVLVSLDALPPLAGKAVELKAGMTLQGDLLLERRRIVEYLFEPLLGMARNS
ncbi:HlyD family secretion protein [Roseateles sp.]|uniref:HlyD family secretion protein n=1 Tax=Roseateles sp. TaxID=1971397 RepID=UPI002DFCF54B|nr:HlyD family efflux transporter periplasmic adaptor subunit [Roseateles sp.]